MKGICIEYIIIRDQESKLFSRQPSPLPAAQLNSMMRRSSIIGILRPKFFSEAATVSSPVSLALFKGLVITRSKGISFSASPVIIARSFPFWFNGSSVHPQAA